MAKKQRSISLSLVLLRFAIVMLGSMVFCCLLWYLCFWRLENADVICQSFVAYQQVEQMLAGEPKTFISPGDNFIAEYALFDQNGNVLESNVTAKKLEDLTEFLSVATPNLNVLRYPYADGSTVIFHWYYRAEFVDPLLRGMLPPFEYLWMATLGIVWVFCLLFNTLWLRRFLAAKLKLFGEVSAKIGAQELDFTIPHAGIREYDQALDAMEHMREALYQSLSDQWATQQKREAEIAALAHDLKTPLTLVGGNAELLLDEELPERSRKMVATIVASNDRAKHYLVSLLETSAGADESFKDTSLPTMFNELCQRTMTIAETRRICLHTQNELLGAANIQKDHLLRASRM